MSNTSHVLVRVADLQPLFQKAVTATYGVEGFDLIALRKAVAHEFDFLGPWVDVSVDWQGEKPEDCVLHLTFAPPSNRDIPAAEKAFGKATRRAERGDVEGAFRELRDLVSAFPEVAKYWRALGQCQLVLRQWEECEDALLKSLALDPLDPDALTLLGNLYAHRGQLDRALTLYRQSLSRDRNVYALSNAAGMVAKMGALDEAVGMFEEAVQLEPKYPNAWWGQPQSAG